jgi:hypothetical protein
MAMLWRQQADDTDVPIVRTLTVGDQNASGPVEQHDLSQYATTENHAAKVGAYLYARRTLSTHTATVRIKAGNQTGTIAQGDIVQIYLAVETSREAVGRINRFYQVESIGHSLSGEETLSLSHFPVNSSGQSLIALAVANATAPGTTLSSNRTGGSCDIAGASTSTTVPTKSTSGTPISGQATGGASSSTYWAASGQFIDLFGGGTFGGAAPIDSPAGPSEGGARQLANSGGPIGPSTGTNVLGGDAICPNGYSQLVGQWNGGSISWADVGGCHFPQSGFTATSFPDVQFSEVKTFGVFTYQDVTITWNDPSTGFRQANSKSIISCTKPGSTDFVCIFSIYVTSYSCKLASGAAGPTVTGKLYKVIEGDTMAGVSEKMYGTTARAADILAANPVFGFNNTSEVQDYWLMVPGRILTIPN